jgi:hypothetical protein
VNGSAERERRSLSGFLWSSFRFFSSVSESEEDVTVWLARSDSGRRGTWSDSKIEGAESSLTLCFVTAIDAGSIVSPTGPEPRVFSPCA